MAVVRHIANRYRPAMVRPVEVPFLSTHCPIAAAPWRELRRGTPIEGQADPTYQSRPIKWKGRHNMAKQVFFALQAHAVMQAVGSPAVKA